MWNSIADYVAKANTGPTNAIVLSGPASVGSVKESNAAWAKMVKEHPNIKIVATEPTDFTTAVGFSATQTALAQHPDANIILSVYSGVTQGAVKAIQAAHDEGKVKLYDQGGDTASIAAIKEGAQTMTAPDFPYTEIQTVVNLIGNVNTGKVTKPSSIMNDGTTWGQDGGSFFVTKANVDKFKPEY
jgi:ribose transport system substrate-binding protein